MSSIEFVSTTVELAELLDKLNLSTTTPPHLYVDLEGVNLSRNGTISILSLYDRSLKCVYLIDVYALGHEAFSTESATSATMPMPTGQGYVREMDGEIGSDDTIYYDVVTLKAILESCQIPKVFFDVRNDSDALFAHYGVKLDGIEDIQLMELATRSRRNRERVNGLAKCLQFGLIGTLTPLQRSQTMTIKDRGAKLFAPDKGGNYEIFNERPLDPLLKHYCMVDVIHMPALWHNYNKKLHISFWKYVVHTETEKRLEESRSANYIPQGTHKSLGWTWAYLQELEREYNGPAVVGVD